MQHFDPDEIATEAQLLAAVKRNRPPQSVYGLKRGKTLEPGYTTRPINHPLDTEFDDFELGHQHIWR